MAAPKHAVIQVPVQNPRAEEPLYLTMIIVPNTAPEDIEANVRSNTELPLTWLTMKDRHDGVAVIVGGGPSAADNIEDIRSMKEAGGCVFATNGASRWLRSHGIVPDWQVIADAQPETVTLVDPDAAGHLFASHINPATMGAAPAPVVWHSDLAGIENAFPEHRRSQEYCLIGGTSAGTHAMCLASALGYGVLHCFGMDSSHRGDASHAYEQPMNSLMPVAEVEWAGKTYRASIAMKAQAEHFMLTARAIVDGGGQVRVHGDGLLPAMWNTPAEALPERDKYRLLWQFDTYRETSFGERGIETFIEVAKPSGLVLDIGCGTGRAALELDRRGYEVVLIDFADNCRDQEAIRLPFIDHDLTRPLPIKGNVGLCSDVMEHIPTEDVGRVIGNIMAAVPSCFFEISTVQDDFGALIGTHLHNTVRNHDWWRSAIEDHGAIAWQQADKTRSAFLVTSASH